MKGSMSRWKRRLPLAGWLLAAVLGGKAADAQVQTTTVQATITDAGGAAAAGTVVVSWAAFTTAAGVAVPAGSLSTTLGSGGALSVALQPNSGATPMGSYYTAVYHLSDGTTSREFWVVPVTGSGTVTLAAIRNQVLPSSVAMQTVSKQYVDTTVAKAMAGVAPGGSLPYVLKAGDTMAGPLALAADPVGAMQAADKHYVDAAVAGVTAAGAAAGDLSGSYPHPTVSAVHATSGSLDGVAVGSTTASTAQFTSAGLATGSRAAPSLYYATDPLNGFSFRFDGVQYNYGGTGQFLFATGNVFGLSTGVRLGFSPGDVTVTISDAFLVRAGTGTLAVQYGNGSLGNLQAASFHESLTTPASSSASCSAGDFTDDANFHYVCVAAATWKRVALSSF